MAQVEWVKLNVKAFDDYRVKLIGSMENGDRLIIEWVKLLLKAGEENHGGRISTPIKTPREYLEVLKSIGLVDDMPDGLMICDFDQFVSLDSTCVVNEESWRQLREFILRRDNYTCQYCGDKTGPFEADHVIPKSRGGLDIAENLVCACMRCNRSKHNKTPDEWGKG